MIAIVPCEHCGSLNGMPMASRNCIDCGKERPHYPSVDELKATITARDEEIAALRADGWQTADEAAKAEIARLQAEVATLRSLTWTDYIEAETYNEEVAEHQATKTRAAQLDAVLRFVLDNVEMGPETRKKIVAMKEAP